MRFDPELTILCILLAILIVAGCVAVVRVRRWREEDELPPSLEDQLAGYQAMIGRGELDPQEFERIKAQLQGKSIDPPQAETGPQEQTSQNIREGMPRDHDIQPPT